MEVPVLQFTMDFPYFPLAHKHTMQLSGRTIVSHSLLLVESSISAVAVCSAHG